MNDQSPIAPETAAAAPGARPAVEIALRVEGLSVAYRQQRALWNVSFALGKGRRLAVVGPNGAGKSTLLKAILGLVPVESGRIAVFGRPVEEVRLQIAYVPQIETVDWDFPITVREVVLMGRYGHLGYWGRPGAKDHAAVEGALESVGMKDFADRQVRLLSGGQQQRVFLARALAQEASLMLLDEPLAGVDARTEAAIFELMARFSREGRTLVVVHHDLQTLDRFDDVLMLNQVCVAFGPVEQTVTAENIRRTYGGRLAFVQEADRRLRRGGLHEER